MNNTKKLILDTGLSLWKENPDSVTARNIARKINMTHGTVGYHFPEGVKSAVAVYAVEIKEQSIIAQLIVTNHPAIRNISIEQRKTFLLNANI